MPNPVASATAPPRGARVAALALVAAAGLACHGDRIVSIGASQRNTRVAALVGERIEVTLQTIGPGQYASPPAISSSAVKFLDVASCGANVPAGPTQCFSFRAAAPGQAVLTFTHTGSNPTVYDTVDVR